MLSEVDADCCSDSKQRHNRFFTDYAQERGRIARSCLDLAREFVAESTIVPKKQGILLIEHICCLALLRVTDVILLCNRSKESVKKPCKIKPLFVSNKFPEAAFIYPAAQVISDALRLELMWV